MAMLLLVLARPWQTRQYGTPQVVRLTVALPEEDETADPGRLNGAPAISPDGKTVIIPLGSGARAALWMRRLDSDRFERLAGTEHGNQPFWSPDGKQIAFFAGGQLKKMAVPDGALQNLCDVPGGANRGGAWSPNGTILYGVNYQGLMRVAERGGEPALIVGLDQHIEENSLRYPQFLADGNHFVYFSRTVNPQHHGIYLDALDTVGKRPRKKIVLADGPSMVGHDLFSGRDILLFPNDGRLWAQRFDAASGSLDGERVAISDDVGQFSLSSTGTLVFHRIGSQRSTLVWFDRSGRLAGSVGKPGDYWDLQLSPDEQYAAALNHSSSNGNFWVEIIDLSRNLQSPFSDRSVRSFGPVWSRDSKQLYFTSVGEGANQILVKPVDGAGSARQVATSPALYYLRDLSPDGNTFLADRQSNPSQSGLASIVSGEFQWRSFGQSTAGALKGQFSPDGRWVAYQSNESGASEIYISDFPGIRHKFRISTAGGTEPRWRHDGKELFYMAPGGTVMVVSMENSPNLSGARPVALFKFMPKGGDAGFLYAASQDGKRFLVVNWVVDAGSRGLSIVFNWPQLLRRDQLP